LNKVVLTTFKGTLRYKCFPGRTNDTYVHHKKTVHYVHPSVLRGESIVLTEKHCTYFHVGYLLYSLSYFNNPSITCGSS